MKNILLLTDFSNNAQNAIDYALAFFKGGSYHFFVLNVHKESNYLTRDLMTTTPSTLVYDSVIKDPKSALDEMIKLIKRKYKNEQYTFTAICDHDSFVSAVNQTVKFKNIDVIVMGTNGATGAKEVVFGSNTLNVIRSVNCPVLVIPQNYKYIKLEKILFVTEFDEIIVKKALKPLLYFIEKHNAILEILSLKKEETPAKSEYNNKDEIVAFFKDIKHNYYSITNVPIDAAIDCFVQLKEVGLSSKIINKDSFFKRLISRSKLDNITYKSRIPLLIMHP